MVPDKVLRRAHLIEGHERERLEEEAKGEVAPKTSSDGKEEEGLGYEGKD